MQIVVQISESFHDEHNAHEISNKDIFKSIVSESHFSLYPDIFNDGNSFPLGINDISENIEADLNQSPLSFDQDREAKTDHSVRVSLVSPPSEIKTLYAFHF